MCAEMFLWRIPYFFIEVVLDMVCMELNPIILVLPAVLTCELVSFKDLQSKLLPSSVFTSSPIMFSHQMILYQKYSLNVRA
jgi:hypothetical protein